MANEKSSTPKAPEASAPPAKDETPKAAALPAEALEGKIKLYGPVGGISLRGEAVPQDADGGFVVDVADVAMLCEAFGLSTEKKK